MHVDASCLNLKKGGRGGSDMCCSLNLHLTPLGAEGRK